jgi:uncharacterized DUF497 family protein
MDYEWDEAKRQANIAKHGVDFADAVGALEDPFGGLFKYQVGRLGEGGMEIVYDGFATLGRSFSDGVVYVVWTERPPDAIRIDSARKAGPDEARQYQEQLP